MDPRTLPTAYRSFAEVLAGFRAARQMSQYRLGARSTVDKSYISRLERGNRMPDRGVVERLTTGLELDWQEADTLRLAAGFAPKGPETS